MLPPVGFGATLSRHLEPHEFRVTPHASSFQLAAARLRWPLQHVTTLSLHGPLHDRAELAAQELEEILRVAQEQHYAIYDSIRSGDERSAESHARRHIRATLHSNLIDQATRGTGS